MRGRRGRWRRSAWPLAWLLLASHARALPGPIPEFEERIEPRFEASIHFENDNKLLGLWQLVGRDGSDVGRTHALTLRLAGVTRRGLRVDFESSTQLFTEQLWTRDRVRLNLRADGTLNPLRWKDRNVWFADLTTVRVLLSRRLAARPSLRWIVGGGAVIVNHRYVGPGGTGQQLWFHRFLDLFSNATREFRYLPDGYGLYAGLRTTLGLRSTMLLFDSRRLSIHLRNDASLELDTIRDGTHVFDSVGLLLGVGRRRNRGLPFLHVGLSTDARLFVGDGDLMMDSRIDLWFHGRGCDYLAALDGYWGSPHRAYYTYNRLNSTTTFGVRCRSAE